MCGVEDDALEGLCCEHGRELPSYSQLLAAQCLVSLASLPYVPLLHGYMLYTHALGVVASQRA